MCKNTIQSQKDFGIMPFLANYGSEEQCENALFSCRWPNGFQCPKCGSPSFCKLHWKAEFQSNRCRHQTSLTSNTIFDSTKLTLTIWLLGIYLINQNKTWISALTLHRQLSISCNAVLRMKHKLMQVMMERDNSWQLSSFVQVDDAYWGRERHGVHQGRGSENKAPFVGAVQTAADNHPLYMSFNAVDNFRRKTMQERSKHALKKGIGVVSDRLSCFRGIEDAGCQHTAIITGRGHASMKNKLFTWVNTMLGNVQTAITGTYHKLDPKQLPPICQSSTIGLTGVLICLQWSQDLAGRQSMQLRSQSDCSNYHTSSVSGALRVDIKDVSLWLKAFRAIGGSHYPINGSESPTKPTLYCCFLAGEAFCSPRK